MAAVHPITARPASATKSRLDYRVDRDLEGRPVVILLTPIATGLGLQPARVRALAELLLRAADQAEAHA